MPRRFNDPYGNFRFSLEVENVEVGSFSECGGLSIETKVFEYQEGGNNATTLKFPETSTYGNVTLKRGVTSSNDLIDWLLDVVNGTFDMSLRAAEKNLAVVLKDERDEPVKRWNLVRAFPIKWTGPDLKANASEVAIETLEITHEGIQVKA
ncbi:MAG TPA: phage tail protein [Pyrinomonadaceae bacterium]|jgi:phage tail-like protein